MDGEKVVVTFEMFKPEMRKGKMIFEFEPILNDPREDLLTGLKGKQLNDISLFIDDATPGVPSCFPNCKDAILKGLDMSGQNLYSDFENANLNNALLNFANLSGADLYGANLNYTKLNEADLHRAYLKGADLTDAELTGAYMNDADLTNANLADANLKGANLAEADLSGANLKGANLTDALWGKTTCPNGTMNSGTSPCTADQLNLA